MNGLREKFRNKKGFTLIEMLIVVAIIAILIAISIPLVNSSLEKARESTDRANMRSAQAIGMIEYMNGTLTAETKYWYKIDGSNSGGSLEPQTGGTKPKGYGQGTAAGDDTTPHTGEIIEVVIDPTKTAADEIVKTSWVAGAT